ncbi:MAG: hypothetical protein ACQESZ_06955 [Bacteroidota bacterium]
MKPWLKTLIWSISIIAGLILLVLIGFILHAEVNKFDPPQTTVLSDPELSLQKDYDRQHFTFITWNIGYGGLGENMDFFYDGGRRVRPTLSEFKDYSSGVYQTISTFSNIDMILLQEVDIESRRSYFNNELKHITELMPDHESFHAVNYKVPFVPMPLYNPLGKVHSGIQVLSSLKPHLVFRNYYSSSYSWPYRLFMLKRGYLKTIYHLKSGQNLVVFNTHNSAFDDGDLRATEFQTIRTDMLNEYLRGNYVVAGGDWNQNPPAYNPGNDPGQYNYGKIEPSLPEDAFPNGWQWVFDQNIPTNRSNLTPYKKGDNTTTIIDYFIVSPNVNVDTVVTQDLAFKYSDHQPVFMRISLPQEVTDSVSIRTE